MKQSENMVLEAMTRLSTVHDALEELLMGAMMRPQTADTNTPLCQPAWDFVNRARPISKHPIVTCKK